jgi:hypothetical protein
MSWERIGRRNVNGEACRAIYRRHRKGEPLSKIAEDWEAAEEWAQMCYKDGERLIKRDEAENRKLIAEACAKADALIKDHIGPDHKVTDMAAFRSALVKAFEKERRRSAVALKAARW